jgi:hypothetical protein
MQQLFLVRQDADKPVDGSHDHEKHTGLAVEAESHPDPVHPCEQLKNQQQEVGDPKQQHYAHKQTP